MQRSFLLPSILVVSVALMGVARTPTSAQSDAFVRLQSSSTATTQIGNIKISGEGHLGSLRIGTTATSGYVLTTNALGVASWAPVNGISLPFDQTGNSAVATFKVTNSNAAGIGIFGFTTGNGAGLHGRNVNGNNGSLGTGLYGAEGVHSNGNLGRLGTVDAGVLGTNTMTGNAGQLGTMSYGVYGTASEDGVPIYGVNATFNNYGYLGSQYYGVYGYHDMTGNSGLIASNQFGAFGRHAASGNIGALGAAQAGIYGTTPTTTLVAVLGVHIPTSNQGYIGSSQYGVYGFHNTSQNYGALGSSGAGVYAYGAAGYGIQAISASGSLSAVIGQNSSGGPAVSGVATVGIGVIGTSNVATGVSGTSQSSNGVTGISASATASGVFGDNTGGGYGVAGHGSGSSAAMLALHSSGNSARLATQDYGLWAEHQGTMNRGYVAGVDFGLKGTVSGNSIAVVGSNASSQNSGWLGGSTEGVLGTGVSGHGVMGTTGLTNASGVFGQNSSGGPGVEGSAVTGPAVKGSSVSGPGLMATSTGANAIQGYTASPTASGVYGENTSTGYGVAGRSTGTGTGIIGINTNPAGFAGYFMGRILIDGNMTAATKNFMIDHPLDPLNKFLLHSCVESNVRMDIYKGRVTTDAEGYAWVDLPDYFSALNRDIEYHLTVLGQFAQVMVAQEVENNRFLIRTDKPRVKVSWQVLGDRQDAYARAHPLIVEQEKVGDQVGKYLHPLEHGAPAEQGINYGITGGYTYSSSPSHPSRP